MVNNEKERKELMEAIRILLKTAEELKIVFTPLCRGQEDALKVLNEHGGAIINIMDKLIGTQEEHKKMLKSLDLLRIDLSQLDERVESHETVSMELKKRLEKLEFKQIRRILEKIVKREVLSVNDLEVVEGLLSLYPDDEYLLSVKSEVLNGLGREQEALEFLEKAISKNPNGARLWYVKGLLLEDLDEQIKYFDKSLELLKDGPPINQHIVLHSRAILLVSAQRFEEALESVDKAVETFANCYDAWVLKGRVLTKLSRIPEALGCFEKATELNRKREKAWFEKGNALFALGPNYSDETIACYDKAIELNPKFAIAYFNKARLLEGEKALQTIDKGLEFDNKKSCAWCDRGTILNRLRRNKEALKSFERALELGPPKECNEIFLNMAIILYHLGRHKEGAEFAKRIVEAEPENVKFWDIFASNLQALGRDEEALKAFEKALSLRKSDEEISWDDLAKLYERMGRTKEAKQAYQKFKSIQKKRSTRDT